MKIKLILIAFILSAVGLIAGEISSPVEYKKQAFDVLHYDALLDFSAAPSKDMTGRCDISIQWEGSPAGEKFYFHLRDLTVDSVFYSGVRVEAIEVGEMTSAVYHYEVEHPAQISSTLNKISIYYHGTMTSEPKVGGMSWGGVHSLPSEGLLYVMGVGFMNNYISATQHWLPCYDHPSDKATFHCKFVVPAGQTAAATGELINIEYLDNGTDIYEWKHDYQCATYLYAFAVGNYQLLDLSHDELPIHVYSLPADTAASRYAYKNVYKMVDCFEERFGEYPFEKVGFANTPIGSMEHQTLVSMAERIIQNASLYKDSNNTTIAHELSHQWFGNKVSPLDFREAWLNESFAVFSEAIWQEYLGGYEAYVDFQRVTGEDYFNKHVKREGVLPLYDFSRESPSSNYPVTIYDKGCTVVGMLRQYMGEEAFFAGIRTYLDDFAYGCATSEGLKDVLEEAGNKDLDFFFDQWIYGIGWPEFEIEVNLNDNKPGKADIRFTQIQPEEYGTFTNVPIQIGFRKEDNSVGYKTVIITEKDQLIQDFDIPEFELLNFNEGPDFYTLMKVKGLTVGIDDEIADNELNISVYPNPTTDYLNIRFSTTAGNANINLFNSTGIELLNKNISTINGINKYSVSTIDFPNGSLSSGIYFIRIQSAGEIATKKITIIR
ncbi:MAG: M1 family aminopeptidase [Candidatus Kapabacteria bacterium]|jgi:aminopeptidase N|nr:M1 family aminopeptidase [Candidatus Kapabacteria bacterium]